ncbi:MAG: tRNA (adenosine(37)-N6)-threonylcarbamoyltransferase complex transferase subunit TsaD [Phycisphaerales bacterium]|nr:tRNA (adenosine(37)-N6)-threonylcarbamoyltransferase complex transferase subunit TsaD [Phycisphaerales bacterium]
MPMLILGIESTCDETAAAVVADGVRVLSSTITSQVQLHEKFRGVVPEIASRAHIENILPVINQALESAHCRLQEIDAFAIAHRPGLIGSLLVGVTAAKTLAWTCAKPLIAVDHVHAHLYSVNLQPADDQQTSLVEPASPPALPAVGLVVSGGHTALYHLKSWTDVTLIGSTIDDAVGEAYDKVAAILGLSYPGGPIIDQLAQQGDPNAIRFPRSLLGRNSLDFSFSGLKTSVLYHVRGHKGRQRDASSLSQQEINNVAASFQSACIDVIIKKLLRARKQVGARSIVIGGGVSANRGLRSALAGLDIPVHLPAPAYCTDNAAMTAGLGYLLHNLGQHAALDLDAIPFSQFAAP